MIRYKYIHIRLTSKLTSRSRISELRESMEMFKCFRKRISLRGCSEKNQCDPGDIQQSASRHLQEHIENLTTKVNHTMESSY
jgi:hypothetical protein